MPHQKPISLSSEERIRNIPEDELPELYGCTSEACAFQNKLGEFKNQNTFLFGASTQTIEQQNE